MKLTLVTSIYPGNSTIHRHALASWVALPGVEIISLNAADELPYLLQEGYGANVRFLPAQRDGRAMVRRPLVHIYDAIAAGLASDASMIGVINSDIILRVAPDFVERLWLHTQGGMVFGSRVDIPDAEALTGQVYTWGFDYFFMDRTTLGCLEDAPFFFGVPWWDYWLPISFIVADHKIARLASPIGFHVTHPVRWNPILYEQIGNHYGEFIRRNFSKRGWADVAWPQPSDPYWGMGTLRRLAQCEPVNL